MNKQRNALLLGGSGFIGKQLAFALANRGWHVTVPCRRPHRNRSLLVHPNISLLEANITDETRLRDGQQMVINLVGILHERRKGDFRRYHVDFIKAVVEACCETGIKRLLHVSALGADQATGSSLYLRSKGEGENLLHTFGQRGLQVTSFQPSVVFGKEDDFINRFAGILKLFFGYFPLACADSKLAPVYVGDLVERMVNAVDDRESYAKRYSVCGPEVFFSPWTTTDHCRPIMSARTATFVKPACASTCMVCRRCLVTNATTTASARITRNPEIQRIICEGIPCRRLCTRPPARTTR
jgi:NADH dehydrogenase